MSLSSGPGSSLAGADAREVLCRFRWDVYGCLDARADVLVELADALACTAGPVRSLPELSLEPEHRRGHGGLYDAVNAGRVEFARIRRTLAGLALPRVGRRIVLGVDVTPWLRPDAETSPERLFCHVHGRATGTSQMIPGWPYSIVAALEAGRTSWTAVLDAVRLGPDDDATAVTAAQLREVVERLIVAAGHWAPGDPPIDIVMDSGYDVARLAFVLADLPVVVTGRLRSDRVMIGPIPPRPPSTMGRPARHGSVLNLARPDSWPEPGHATITATTRYGTAVASAWGRMHPRLTRRGPWLDHPEDTDLPIIEGTLIRLQVDHLPGDRTPKPLWLWTSRPQATAEQVHHAWQAFLRRFDLEHTFRGGTVPLCDPRRCRRVVGWIRHQWSAPVGTLPSQRQRSCRGRSSNGMRPHEQSRTSDASPEGAAGKRRRRGVISEFGGRTPDGGGVEPTDDVVGVDEGLDDPHGCEPFRVADPVDVVAAIARVGADSRPAEQLPMDHDGVEQARDGRLRVEGELGTQVDRNCATVDEQHGVEVQIIGDVHRGVPAAPVEVAGPGRAPVDVRVGLQRRDRRPSPRERGPPGCPLRQRTGPLRDAQAITRGRPRCMTVVHAQRWVRRIVASVSRHLLRREARRQGVTVGRTGPAASTPAPAPASTTRDNRTGGCGG